MITVKVKTPKPIPDLLPIVQTELDKELKTLKREFGYTTTTFKMHVVFRIRRYKYSGAVYTDNRIYGYLNDGTKEHPIRVKNAASLRFNTKGFQAKTVPNRLNPRAGRAAKPPTAYPIMVLKHPGTKARHYDKLLQKRSEVRYARNMRKAIQQAIKRRR